MGFLAAFRRYLGTAPGHGTMRSQHFIWWKLSWVRAMSIPTSSTVPPVVSSTGNQVSCPPGNSHRNGCSYP